MDWDKPGQPSVGHPSPFLFFLALCGQKTPKRIGMTSLGFPGLSSQSVLRFLALFGQKTPKRTGTQGPYPSPFQGYLDLFGQKAPKQIGMTSLGFPGLSSQVFVAPFRRENPETDWDNKLGLPKVVIPVRFGVFWPFSARKPRNGLG